MGDRTMDRARDKAKTLARRQARQVKQAARTIEPESNFVENDTVPNNVYSLDSRRDRAKQEVFISRDHRRVA